MYDYTQKKHQLRPDHTFARPEGARHNAVSRQAMLFSLLGENLEPEAGSPDDLHGIMMARMAKQFGVESSEIVDSLQVVRQVNPHAGRELRLDEAIADRMQRQFGIRMNQVELRESPQVAQMDAKAFAKGNVVQFAPGQFQPDTAQGLQLLQHELSHVAQQARGVVHADVPGFNINVSGNLERQADAGFFAGGASGHILSPVSAEGAPVQGMFGWLKKVFQFLFPYSKREIQEAQNGYNAISNTHYRAAESSGLREAGKAYIKDSRDVNAMLRTRDVSTNKKDELDKMAFNLSAMMQELPSEQTVYRGISDAGLLPLLELAGMGKVIKPNGTIDHKALLARKNELQGLTFQDNGFVSTSASRKLALDWSRELPYRDLGLFKRRALERWLTPEKRNKDNVLDSYLKRIEEDGSATVEVQQNDYALIADDVLTDNENVKEKDIKHHLMEIALPEKTKALFLDRFGADGYLPQNILSRQKMEILLDKGARFRIDDIKQGSDKEGEEDVMYYIVLKLLGEEEEQPE